MRIFTKLFGSLKSDYVLKHCSYICMLDTSSLGLYFNLYDAEVFFDDLPLLLSERKIRSDSTAVYDLYA